MTKTYDVAAVSLSTNKVRILARNKTVQDAEAIVCMAAVRRGVQEEFFSAVETDTYKDGDEWSDGGGL